MLVIAAAAIAVGCADNSAGPADDAGTALAPPVEALRARLGTLPLEERLNGTVKAENQVTVRAEIEAPIVEVHVRSGEAVGLGQPLVRLDDAALVEQLRQVEATLRLAEAASLEAGARTAELEVRVGRTRSLAEQELISAQELETLEAQLAGARAAAAQAAASVDEARATVEQRRTALSRTVVRSPVSGRVGRRSAEVGMIASPGTPLFEVGNLSKLIVEVPLTEEMLGYIETGHPVQIRTPATRGAVLQARLSRISPFLAPGTFSTTGEIDVDNRDGRLMPGMFVTVDVLYGESASATLVPSSALWEDPASGRWGVYVVDLGGAEPAQSGGPGEVDPAPRPVEFRAVEVLAVGRDQTGLRGLEPGEWVVVIGHHLLRPDSGVTARVRVASWDRVLELQGLQREDLLQEFLDKQQRWARERGAAPPDSREFLRGSGAPAADAPTGTAGGSR
jgi:RND family efflux transporter MFP subunit